MVDTFTSKLGLRKPDRLNQYLVSQFNANADLIDANVGSVICTSVTRPAIPWEGQTIYETDTRRVMVYSSGSWRHPAAGKVSCTSSTRPASPYTGMEIWQTDKNLGLMWNGTAWIAEQYCLVGALADIPAPFTGQVAQLATDNVEYWWSGSTWSAVRLAAPNPNLQMRLNVNQAVSAATDTKISFDTIINAGPNISYGSGNFTFARAGVYLGQLSLRHNTASGFYAWFAKSANSLGNRGKSSTGSLNLGISAEIRVAAAEQWSAFCWNGLATTLTRENSNADDYAPWISFSYLRPL